MGLGRRFGAVQALRDISISLPKGEPIGLVGPNGSGKTTFFSVLCGFLSPSAGRVSVLGLPPRHPDLRDRISVLPQDARLHKGIPIYKQLAFLARLQGMEHASAKREARKVLDEVGLGENANQAPEQLSHGMLKRAAIAQAFIGEPELVLLDEPTAGLDPVVANRIRALIKAHQHERTFLVSSHNLDEVENLCSTLVILHKGRVTEHRSMSELISRASYLRFRFESRLPDEVVEAMRRIPSVEQVELGGADGRAVAVRFTESPEVSVEIELLQLFRQRGIRYIQMTRGQSLEDKVVELTQ